MSNPPALAVLAVLGLALHISTSSRWAEDGSPAPTSMATVTPDSPGPEPFRITEAGGSHTAAWRAVCPREVRAEHLAWAHLVITDRHQTKTSMVTAPLASRTMVMVPRPRTVALSTRTTRTCRTAAADSCRTGGPRSIRTSRSRPA